MHGDRLSEPSPNGHCRTPLGEAKTDRSDAYYILADTARTRRKQVRWLDASSDELLAQLRVLNGFDTDRAEDQTRVTNRLRDAMTSISPGLERALGKQAYSTQASAT